MYEHYKPAQQIFVNREEYLSWMDEALESCREKSRILHLRGIGGIGKSTLLNYWTRTIEKTVKLDCQQYTEFYSRLDVIAKGAVRVGINLKRFDILWHIRKRFVEGVEPATEKGREWAKEVLVAIPFIGSLASIGSAIKSVGDSVAPKIRQRYGEVGQWLQDRLGTNYLERVLEILWKDPQHAEFLYLDALLEDINNRKNLDTPLLFLFDHSENVDAEEKRWNYDGKMIAEMELWYVFVSSLKNCVGVIASRRALPQPIDRTLEIDEKELTELERESCLDLLNQRGVTEPEFQERIVSISGGNPFVISAICDMRETTEIAINDIENLGAETLDEVRLKTWRRLFGDAKDLLNLVDRAGLLPSFDKDSMNIVAPGLKTDQWERMIRLSFLKPRSNGTWVLHDLARDLVRAELGTQMNSLVTEVSELLENASSREKNPALLGTALSVKALDSEEDAISETKKLIRRLIDEGHYKEAFTVVDNLVFRSEVGEAMVLGFRGMMCEWLRRYAEAEFPLREAIRILEQSAIAETEQIQDSLGVFLNYLGDVLNETGRYTEAESEYVKAVDILRKLAKSGKEDYSIALLDCLNSFAYYYYKTTSAPKGLPYAFEALELARGLDHPMLFVRTLNVAAIIIGNTGDWERQKEMYQEAIDLHRENLKKSDTPIGKTLLAGILGNYSLCLQNYDEIEEIFKEVFELREAVAEEFPQNQAFSKIQYAVHCLSSHKLQRAEKHLKESQSFYEDYAKEEPEASAAYLFYLRLLLCEVYIFSDNLSIAQEVLTKLEVFHPKDIATTSSVGLFAALGIHGLSGLCHALSHQTAKAQRDYEISMDTIDRMVIDSPEVMQLVIFTLNNYSIFLHKTGKFDDSEEVLNKALNICKLLRTHWTSAGITSILQANLAIIHHYRSDYVEADRLNSEVIETLEKYVIINKNLAFPFITKSLHNSSVFLSALERYDESLKVIQRTLQMKRELVDEDLNAFRPSLATSLNNLGVILYMVGRPEEAISQLEDAIEIRRELVAKNPDIHSLNLASTLQNMAIVLHREGQASESQKRLTEALEIREEYIASAREIIANFPTFTPDEILEKEIWSLETEPMYLAF